MRSVNEATADKRLQHSCTGPSDQSASEGVSRSATQRWSNPRASTVSHMRRNSGHETLAALTMPPNSMRLLKVMREASLCPARRYTSLTRNSLGKSVSTSAPSSVIRMVSLNPGPATPGISIAGVRWKVMPGLSTRWSPGLMSMM